METVDEILANVPNEGENPFKDTETDTPAASPTEKEPETSKPAEGDSTPEENIPFHKHPRWIERENELKAVREREEEMTRELADLKAFKEDASQRLPSADTSIPDWFRELYGDNQVAWQKYAKREQERESEIENRLIQKQEEQRKAQSAEADRWNKWVDTQLSQLEAEGKQFDRNELIKTMLEYRPTDQNNNFDFQAGFKIYDALKPKDDPAKSQARKEIADRTTHASTTGEKKSKDYLTPDDLRNRSWGSL